MIYILPTYLLRGAAFYVTMPIDSAQPVSFRRSGGADPGDFGDRSVCPASLPAGDSCAISVTFKPTAAGSRTASLSILDSVGTQTVALAGTENVEGRLLRRL
jgi:hypothetical protein